ncbi:MAG: DNA repair protein RecN [Gammaproteobacteria bacterium]|nr:DNA repair protein RecN [Gammaproteobacteria bacterium]MBT8106152.1 DNA repair protein RecN [Gammaproteobacteria bacterium]NNF48580.1 DNA repair protein RecN [Woeseiaceae bacterium]NNK26166.1 DNA repair protein RecN [Woeseiaceae bacterium]NNL63452.1 DNA repair protein RecN [Woeseiaceae bacterium]
MLTSLQVRNFAIVDRIDVELQPGMTVLTGETGAGKSILVDALGLVLGDRGSAQLVRDGAPRAEFAAAFDISSLPAVGAWLEEQALDLDDECLLRRVINADGRSRAFVNGNAVPVSQLKSLGELLVDIHGQHFHQSLARRDVQRDLLDHFGGLLDARAIVATHYIEWQSIAERLERLLAAESDRASRLDLLTFQLQELDSLNIRSGEHEELQNERQKLANSGRLAEGIGAALDGLYDSDQGNANGLVAEALRSLEQLVEFDADLAPASELLQDASIHLGEAADLLRRYGETIDMDPARRDWVEDRLDAIRSVCRKHRVEPEALPALVGSLREEHDELSHAEERGRELEQQADAARAEFLAHAQALSAARRDAAAGFEAAVSDAMQGLGMPGGVFEVALTALDESGARPWGIDNIEFLISANPGQAPQSLAKIASGGELSRMSLAIQVIASDGSEIPTMVFDEVDSGVGGGVAEMVGRRLQELGARRQVLCVTHLPQVASLADQHFRVSKVTDGKATRTQISALTADERTEELARMLGGVEITRKTLEHAAEMLAGGRRKRA